MSIARVTSKGQVTIPADVRKELGIDRGDDLVFEVTSKGSAELKVLKRKRLSDLYRSLPATRPFPGKEEIRRAVGSELGKTLRGKRS